MTDRFSDRQGYRAEQQEISIREDAPEDMRLAIPLIAQDAGMTPTAHAPIVCQMLLVRPDPINWSDYPNVWQEVNQLIADCPGSRLIWMKVLPRSRIIGPMRGRSLRPKRSARSTRPRAWGATVSSSCRATRKPFRTARKRAAFSMSHAVERSVT